ncbi:MAG TPA: SDR family oxidoreductase [Nocardioidaceae bacterium]|nr:SDR family oxidoreductase [Nocardioidaceae bacterium]
MNSQLNGQVIAVTGAARGIGYTIAAALKQNGARVAIADIDKDTLEKAAADLGADFAKPLDVTDAAAFRSFLEDVEAALGPLDGLVNNAGVMPTGPLLEQDDAITRRVIEINTLGTMFGTKAALSKMTPRGRGHIVNVASTMGETPVPGLAAYNASKAASIMFSDAARLEFRTSGVRVSVVLPGAVKTELATGIKGPKGIPPVAPEDVAQAVVRTFASGKSHPRVYVPRTFGVLLGTLRATPRSIAEPLARAMGSESAVLQDSDLASRASYEARIRRS